MSITVESVVNDIIDSGKSPSYAVAAAGILLEVCKDQIREMYYNDAGYSPEDYAYLIKYDGLPEDQVS